MSHSDPDTFDPSNEVVAYERSPLDVFRTLMFALGAAVVVLSTRFLRTGIDGVEEDMSSILTFNNSAMRATLDSLLITAMVLTALVTIIVPLATRRWRLFGYVLVANVAASLSVAAINAWVGDLDTLSTASIGSSGIALDMSTDVAAATQVVAAFLALSPFVSARWRRAGIWLVVAMIVLRIAVAHDSSSHSLLVLTLGGAIGSAVLLAFGRPTTQPRPSAITDALGAGGLVVRELNPASVDARGSVPWFATLDTDDRIFVKVLGTDQRAADLLFRMYRMLRLRNVGDERPFSSLRRTVEHEALVALAARDVEVRTPRLRTMAAIGGDGFLLAYDMLDGASLDSVHPDELSDEVLAGIWSQVAVLQAHRIAHRDLRLANMFLAEPAADSDGSPEPWIIDFGFSEIAASDQLLHTDVAQLLASFALVVGTRRAVAPAVEALGKERVAASLTRLQPAALSGSTQAALKENDKLLDQLRKEIQRVCDVSQIQLEPVTRFNTHQLALLVLLVVVIYVVIPQLTDVPDIFDQVRQARWGWLTPTFFATIVVWVASGVSMVGSVPTRLALTPTIAAQISSSYANKMAPTRLGGMELNVRFLQKQGLSPGASASAVGLNAVAVIVGYIVLGVVFIVWALGGSAGRLVTEPLALLVGAASVVALGIVALTLSRTRALVVDEFKPLLQRSPLGLEAVASVPGKLIMLVSGSAAIAFFYAAAFAYTTKIFGIDSGFAALVSVYLVATLAASIAPTPGGLGSAEVALVAGLVAIGVDAPVAVPTVFVFRIVTYWIPVLPGWAAFAWLRRTDRL